MVTEFGNGGVLDLGSLFVEEAFGFEGPAVQPDGKIVIAGTIRAGDESEICVLRIDTSGVLDPEFGEQGIVSFDLGTGLHRAREVFVLPDGVILVLGVTDLTGDSSSFIARFLADGTPDPEFGNEGVIVDNLVPGSTDFFVRGAVQQDRKLLLGSDVARVYRLLPDGTRDSSFGAGFGLEGWTRTRSDITVPTAIAFGDDGFLYVAGGYNPTDASHDFFLTRLWPNGDTDFEFAGQGLVEIDATGSNDFVTDLAIGANGSVVVIGTTYASGISSSAIARVTPEGAPDTTFGNNAVVLLEIPGRSTVLARSVENAPDGRILIAGSTTATDGTRLELFVARLLDTGQLDATFGNSGYTEIDAVVDSGIIFIGYDRSDLVLHPDGRLLMLDWEADVMAMFDYELGDLVPETPQFAPVTSTALDEPQSSAPAIVQGLSSGAAVALEVRGGEYAIDSDAAFATLPARVKAGQQVTLRHVAAPTVATDTTTTLTLGGYRRKNNASLVHGETVTGAFVSTTTQAPVFDNAPTSASLEENIPAGALVATVLAEDADGDALGYSLIAGNDAGAFSINDSAQLRVAGPVDFESRDTYALTVRADDFKGGWATHSLVVHVSDVPEPPVITSGSGAFSVAEDAAVGLEITTIVAHDPEGSVLDYRIDGGNDASRFEIDAEGVLTLAGPLDFEDTSSYALAVVVEDANGASASATVSIEVTNVNEGGSSPTDDSSGDSGGGGGGPVAPVGLAIMFLGLLDRARRAHLSENQRIYARPTNASGTQHPHVRERAGEYLPISTRPI